MSQELSSECHYTLQERVLELCQAVEKLHNETESKLRVAQEYGLVGKLCQKKTIFAVLITYFIRKIRTGETLSLSQVFAN